MVIIGKGGANESQTKVEKRGYKIVYVPHNVIEDYNATYNVIYKGKQITTNASKTIGVPLNQIWISEMWRPYAEYIIFHEIKEIEYKAAGSTGREAHKRAVQDALDRWRNDRLFRTMVNDMKEMDRKTKNRKAVSSQYEAVLVILCVFVSPIICDLFRYQAIYKGA